jgi:hypothetical protein
VRATPASTVSAGLEAASRPEIRLIVCDVATDARRGLADLRHADLPCPLLLRHDLSRQSIDSLYDVSRMTGDVRTSYRDYDDLGVRLSRPPSTDDSNATRAILRAFAAATDRRLRDFVALMAILGERPVMQSVVANALAMSPSSFRAWLAGLRDRCRHVPPFPRLNAHFVALHVVWRRDRLGWTAKRAAGASGFLDDKTCGNYLRYHLGATSGQLLRAGGFDAHVTAVTQLFCLPARDRDAAVRRI